MNNDNISKTLTQALYLIEEDVKRIQVLLESSPEPLDRNSAAKLTDYVKTLVVASKNDREVAKHEGLDKLSDEELEQMAIEAAKSLGHV